MIKKGNSLVFKTENHIKRFYSKQVYLLDLKTKLIYNNIVIKSNKRGTL